MAKRRAAWWWIDRWRKSTAYTDMSLAEQGAYRNLLDELWLRGGILPNDDRILAKISGDAVSWPVVRDAVLSRFVTTPAGLRNETHDEVAGADKFHKSQSDKGKIGAAVRWGKPKQPIHEDSPANSPASEHSDSQGHSPQMASVLRTPSPSPFPLPDPSPEERQNGQRPCDHGFARKRFAETGRTVVCGCGEEFRSEPPDEERIAKERAVLRMGRESAEVDAELAPLEKRESREAIEFIADGKTTERDKLRGSLNPANWTRERLDNTWLDMRNNLAVLRERLTAAKARQKRAG